MEVSREENFADRTAVNAEYLQVMATTTIHVLILAIAMMIVVAVFVAVADDDSDDGAASHPAQDFRDWPILPIKVQPTYKLLGYTLQKPVPLPSHLPLEKNRGLRVGGEDECVAAPSLIGIL
jgi:hypothetical protein